jgi:hypothetical protein
MDGQAYTPGGRHKEKPAAKLLTASGDWEREMEKEDTDLIL